jgi:hypothetical protein
LPKPIHLVVAVWLAALAFLARESMLLNGVASGASVFRWLGAHGVFGAEVAKKGVSPAPGQALSFALGWIGFTVILLTNLYVLRKRRPAWQKLGKLSRWLDVHILFGLLGPTIIVFHTNFQVNGLVAVSFWCMMTSFASGIVGRYFYTQVLRQRVELKAVLTDFEARFAKLTTTNQRVFSKQALAKLKEDAFVTAGGSAALLAGKADALTVLFDSVVGDVRLLLQGPPVPHEFPRALRRPLKEYAVARRRLAAAGPLRRLMGYWHAFHLPFAVFMYVVTVIHIVSALVFRVNH